MRVLVVRVRVMRVAVAHGRVVVCMGVHLAGGEYQSGLVRVIVLVVQVVAMRMAVVHGFMHMRVRMGMHVGVHVGSIRNGGKG